MKKSSLGRRNSNRQSFALGRPSADASSTRKSGIPVPQTSRSKSTERPSARGLPQMDRARSITNLHMLDMMTPAKTPLSSRFQPGQGTERPSRATSYGAASSSSMRTSSYGGVSKRDNRPLQEKEWQAQAYNFIENIINRDPNGPAVLGPGLKPLSLNKFVDACDLLLKMLDGSVGITKHNYIKELPFLLGKKMLYKGKMEKSWMITVNTPHAIPYALGLLHFLAQCANILMNVDIVSLMFPCQFDNNQMCEMNFQLLIPYYNHSYELQKSNAPNYEAYQEELDQRVMEQHYEQDDARARSDALAQEIDRLEEQLRKMQHEDDLAHQEYEAEERKYKNSLETIKEKEEELVKTRIVISTYKSDSSDSERVLSSVESELEILKEEHAKLLKKASEQAVTHKDIENVKKKRDSLDREIISNQKYIVSYQDMLYSEDLEIVKLKTEIEELTRESNLRVMKYVPIESELEKMVLPTRLEDLDLSLIQQQKGVIENLKTECVARSKQLSSDKAAAICERDEVKKILNGLESSLSAQKLRIDCLKSECDFIQDACKKEQIALEAELARINGEIGALEKQARDLQIESDTKKDLVSKRCKENEACEKIMEETARYITAKALATFDELDKLKIGM